MTPEQTNFFQRICDHCDDFAARKSLCDEVEEQQLIQAGTVEILTPMQIGELSRRLFDQEK